MKLNNFQLSNFNQYFLSAYESSSDTPTPLHVEKITMIAYVSELIIITIGNGTTHAFTCLHPK